MQKLKHLLPSITRITLVGLFMLTAACPSNSDGDDAGTTSDADTTEQDDDAEPVDMDGDGVMSNIDEDDNDPCVPNMDDPGCVAAVDVDNDGVNSDTDPDDNDPCVPDDQNENCDSTPVDNDGDGVLSDTDPNDDSACIPDANHPNCQLSAYEYSGVEEEGVVCGEEGEETTCNLDSVCCVSASVSLDGIGLVGNCLAAGECSPGGFPPKFPFECDDASDCASGQECCVSFSGSSAQDIQADSICVTEGTCAAPSSVSCISSSECGTNALCCAPDTSSLNVTLPLEIGVCFQGDSCEQQ